MVSEIILSAVLNCGLGNEVCLWRGKRVKDKLPTNKNAPWLTKQQPSRTFGENGALFIFFDISESLVVRLVTRFIKFIGVTTVNKIT